MVGARRRREWPRCSQAAPALCRDRYGRWADEGKVFWAWKRRGRAEKEPSEGWFLPVPPSAEVAGQGEEIGRRRDAAGRAGGSV